MTFSALSHCVVPKYLSYPFRVLCAVAYRIEEKVSGLFPINWLGLTSSKAKSILQGSL